MPELPEVETIRQDLRKVVVNKKITNVWLSNKAIIKNTKPIFLKTIENNKFIDVSRIGKLLVFVLAGGKYLLIHLKMTGQLIYQHGKRVVAGGHPEPTIAELPNKFTRIIIGLADKGKLYFNDIRRFGYMQIVDEQSLNLIKKKFGPEPLQKGFTLSYLRQALVDKNKPIKTALMDQDKIAGIGNIYASEICFMAGVRPTRLAKSLGEAEIKLLYQACKKVLQKAIKNRGTTFSDYVDAAGRGGYNISFLNVYDREGERCKICQKAKIKKIMQAGRGSFYCPECQK